MRDVKSIYRPLPFWSWNGTLEEETLIKQIDRMHENGIGGFFMHARGGLTTPYLGEKWFSCVDACARRAKELGMEAYAYDENGWPSGFVGGKLLLDPMNRDRYLTHKIGAYDKDALASFLIEDERLVRVTEAVTGECLNVYEHLSPSTADILNGEVVDKFIALTHEEYKKRDRHGIKGFFTDEPQYFRWGFPYTRVMPDYFRERYGEDFFDGMGLLFLEKEGYRAFRYKFWCAMQELMLKNFAEKIYNWCDENGYKFTGHYIEEITLAGQMNCCAGIMPFYEFEHIPGNDCLGRWLRNENSPKQVGSVAAQLGKKQVLTEIFAMCGWDTTPFEMKRMVELHFVGGVNLLCHHLLPYEEHGQRKRDYPPHFSDINPWVKKSFRTFNDYFSVLGNILSESEEQVRVGVLHPIRSAYFDYTRGDGNSPMANGGPVVEDLDRRWAALITRLTQAGLPHHFIDETILSRHGSVEGGKLTVGKCTYDAIILPYLLTMDKTTEAFLRQFVAEGGKVLLTDGKPSYLEGEPYDYDYLTSNVTLDELLSRESVRMTASPSVRMTVRRDHEGRDFIYAVNLGDDEMTVTFTAPCAAFSHYDILADEYRTVGKTLHFDAGESYLLYFSDTAEPKAPAPLSPLRLSAPFRLREKVENAITLDTLSYSTDGVNYSEPYLHMGVFSELLDRRYAGKLYLKYRVDIRALPSRCRLLAEIGTGEVFVNGVCVKTSGVSELDPALLAYDIAAMLKTGENELLLTMDYYQSENVYDVLFGDATESLKNCLAYDSNIEAVYLFGDFGVYGDFRAGKNPNVLIGDNFYLGEQKTEITSHVTDGFPFFAGTLPLSAEVEITDTRCELVFDKFHLADLRVNGKDAGRMMFSHRHDLSAYLKAGKNTLDIDLCIGNRNLFGPFHTAEEEPVAIGPGTWERLYTWKNGKSTLATEGYAFVKTFL